MKSKDTIILKKILDYCRQVDDACVMFNNSYQKFEENSVFHNACCMCILQIGELCKVVSDELRQEEKVFRGKNGVGLEIFLHINILT